MTPSEKQEYIDRIPEEARKSLSLDNDGNVVFKNRAYRRKKQPTDNWYTKSTHQIQKKRDKIRAKAKRHS